MSTNGSNTQATPRTTGGGLRAGYGLSRENSSQSSLERKDPAIATSNNFNYNNTHNNPLASTERDRIMTSERDQRLMNTEPVSKEKVSTEPPGILRDPSVAARKWNTEIPNVLPHERVFPIQIGSELFRLSGASISSDAPSYFSQFFQCQLKTAKDNGDDSKSVRTLYIDRDPVTFKDISLHLQGYHITPRDGTHFVKLFADAQFYSLPRLISQLYEESIFISIGHRDFQIPRDLFSDPGNSPNYFSLGFAVFFSSPTEVFPGLNREGLLRPPSIIPPAVPNRSAETFSQLLHLLRGYPLEIRNEDHRAELLRDCKYFHLKGLEQKLIRHDISFNPVRKRTEITLRLEDVRQSGISVVGDPSTSPSPPQTPITGVTPTPFQSHSQSQNQTQNLVGHINYARPFVDSTAYELVLEIGGSSETKLHFTYPPIPHSTLNQTPIPVIRAEFFGATKSRVSRLFEVVAAKLNLPTTTPLGLLMRSGGMGSQPASPGNSGVSEDLVRVIIGAEAWVNLNDREWFPNWGTVSSSGNYESSAGYGASIESAGSSTVGANEDWEGNHNQNQSQAQSQHSRKKRKIDSFASVNEGAGGSEQWIIRTGQWRLRVQNSGKSKGGVECVLVAVKLDAFSAERGRNGRRGFLAS